MNGPDFAFFDVDDTLVRLKTMFSYQDYYFRHAGILPGVLGSRRSARFDAVRKSYVESGRPREDINRMYYETFRGRRPETVAALARRWYEHVRDGLYFAGTVDALRRHQTAGHEVVLVSGSMVDILRPIADELDVRHILATRVVVRNGRYTGEIVPPQTIGLGKAVAVATFLASQGNDGSRCWAYGDDCSDIPMLSVVGHPVAVSTLPDMARQADARGWQLIDP